MSRRNPACLVIPACAMLAVTGGLMTASAQTSTVIVAPSAPPSPRVETVPPRPPQSQVLTWQAGHWAWNGTAWTWDQGHYVQRPQPTAVWEPGHWSEQHGGYVWVDGHWRG